jgi:hypothetical protein
VKALGRSSVASFVGVALHIAQIVLWGCLAALVLAAIGYGGIYALIGAGQLDPSILTGGAGGANVGDANADFHVSYDTPGGATWPVVVPALAIGGVVLIGALIIVGRLRQLFASFTSGEPFRRENATHLRVIWITMLAMEIARYMLLAIVATVFVAGGGPEGADARFRINVDFSTWISIAVLIVLAEVFREGARMKEEQELTI